MHQQLSYKKPLSGFEDLPKLSAEEREAIEFFILTSGDLAYVKILEALGLFDYAIWWWEDEPFTNNNLFPFIKDPHPIAEDLRSKKPSQERLDFLKTNVFDMYQAAILAQRSGNTNNSEEYFFVSKVEAFKNHLVVLGILDRMDLGPEMDFQFQTPNTYHWISMKNERPCVYLSRIQGRILLRSPRRQGSPFRDWSAFNYTRFEEKVNELIDKLNHLSSKSDATDFEELHSDLADSVSKFYVFNFVQEIFDLNRGSFDPTTAETEMLLEDRALAELGPTQRRKNYAWLYYSNMPIAQDCLKRKKDISHMEMSTWKSSIGSLLLHLCREMFRIFYVKNQITKAQRDYGLDLMRKQLAILDPDYFHLCYDVYGSDVGIPALQILKQFSLRSGKFVLKLTANNFLFMPIAMKLTLDAVRLERGGDYPLETATDDDGNPIPKPIDDETWDAYQITSFVKWYSFFQIPKEEERDEEGREKLETKIHPTPEEAAKTESWTEILYDLFEGSDNQVVPSSTTQNQIIRSATSSSTKKEPYKLMSAPSISILRQKLKSESDAGIFGSSRTKNILLVCGGLLALGGIVYFASKKYKAKAKAKTKAKSTALKKRNYY